MYAIHLEGFLSVHAMPRGAFPSNMRAVFDLLVPISPTKYKHQPSTPASPLTPECFGDTITAAVVQQGTHKCDSAFNETITGGR